MHRTLTLSFALVILGLQARGAHADPIQLQAMLAQVQTDTTVGSQTDVGGINFYSMPFTLNDSSKGGSFEFSAGRLTTDPGPAWYAGMTQSFPVNARFSFELGVPVPGTTDQLQEPYLYISGNATGTLTSYPMTSRWLWGGGYAGAATAATLLPNSRDASQLPAPLLDILNHPDHFHFNVIVTDGEMDDLQATFTFDPPSPAPVPEPSALVTLLAGSAILLLRRRRLNKTAL